MAKPHGARKQKRIAKQKAKRSAKRSALSRRSSKDPSLRLQGTGKWPVVRALVATKLWDEGIGYLLIVRQEPGPGGRLVFASFLVDVYCLGVKDTFWRAGTHQDVEDLIRHMEQVQTMQPITPACLAKIVQGAVEYARSFGFPPHPDFRHASMLLEGIDGAACPSEFTFGRDGKPFYIQGPSESLAQAAAITRRIHDAGGHFLVVMPGAEAEVLPAIDGELEELEELDDDSPDDADEQSSGDRHVDNDA
jgi:hypothetical protein